MKNFNHMDDLPYAASLGALAFIVKPVRDAFVKPELAELVPGLICWQNSAWDQSGKPILLKVPYEFYEVGWCQPQDVTDAAEVNVLGTRIFVHRQTLETLGGKQLVLRSVDSGAGSKAGAKRELLIAAGRPLVETRP
jgi:hypothetical protein